MSDQLRQAIQSNDREHLRCIAEERLPRIDDADWPDRYYLYMICLKLGDSNGCGRILKQIPHEGDRRLQMLPLGYAVFMELLRTHHPAVTKDRQRKLEILKVVMFLGRLAGDEQVCEIAQMELRAISDRQIASYVGH